MSLKEAVLQVHDLSVERRGRLAVERVSFALPAESDTALIGPNGAGKSTLVELCSDCCPMPRVVLNCWVSL